MSLQLVKHAKCSLDVSNEIGTIVKLVRQTRNIDGKIRAGSEYGPATVSAQQSAVDSQQSAVGSRLSIVDSRHWTAVSRRQSAVSLQPPTVASQQSAVDCRLTADH